MDNKRQTSLSRPLNFGCSSWEQQEYGQSFLFAGRFDVVLKATLGLSFVAVLEFLRILNKFISLQPIKRSSRDLELT